MKVEVVTVEAARAFIEQIATDRARLIQRRDTLAQKLKSEGPAAGRLYLGGDTSPAKERAAARDELDLIEEALLVLESDARAAQDDLKRAEAAELRKQAAEKRRVLVDIERRTDALLAQISQIEKIELDRSVILYQRSGSGWVVLNSLAPAGPEHGPGECGCEPTNSRPFAVPFSRQLRTAITELESNAQLIEAAIGLPAPPELPTLEPTNNAKPYGPEIPGAATPYGSVDKNQAASGVQLKSIDSRDPFYRDDRRDDPRGELWRRQ
jgi:hypothetical protein